MKEHFYRILAAVMAMVIIMTGLPLGLAEEQAIELSPEQIAELTAAPEKPTEKASAPEEPAEDPSAEAGEEATVTPEEPTPEPVSTPETIETVEATIEPPEPTLEPAPEATPDAEATAAPEAEPTPEASAEVTAEPTMAAPAANPPELILPPEWQLDGEVLIIPYTAEDESIRLEWRFDGAVQEYRIQTAPVPETGDEEEKLTDVCTCVEAELLLPIADYTEDVYTLYITAVLEDGAAITGMQRFVLMQQASAEVESIPKTPQELADCFGLTLEELAEALGMTMEELMAVDAFTIEEIYNTFSHEINTFSSEVSKSYTGIFETTGNIITTPMNKLIHSHGGVNDGFIPRRSISISKWAHLAGDYTSEIGDDNIFSIADGKVVKSAENNARGCYVVIEHTINNETVYSWYQHMARGSISVKKDDLVKMGDKIGTKGATGNVEGAHLHFALLTSMEEKYPMSSDFANLYGINEIVEDDYIMWQGIKWYNPDKVFLSDGSIIGDGSSNKTLSYENATYKVIKASNIKSEPYSDTENLGRIEVGETVAVTEIVRNRYSNIWVKLRTKNGVEGYVFGGYRQQEDGSLIKDGDMYLKFAGNAKNPVSLSGESLPTGSLSYGKYFSIKGTVSSQNTLKSLTGAIYSDGKCVEKETISCSGAGAGVTRDIDLYSSKINNNLKFGSLENNRSYSFELTAEYYCNRMQATQTQLVAKTSFTIGTPAKPVEPARPVKPKSVTIGEGSKLRLALDQTLQLTAKLAPDGAESRLTWKTSNKKIAMVSSSGLVTPKKTGSVTITVSTENGKTAKTTITIFNPKTPTGVALDKSGTVSLALGSTLQLNATLKPDTAESKLSWKTSNKKVAKVSSSGLVTPKKTGTAKITVTTSNSKKASIQIKVVKQIQPTAVTILHSGSTELDVGDTLQLSAKLNPDGASGSISWKSSNPAIANVDSNGLVTAQGLGTTAITAETYNGYTASINVHITGYKEATDILLNYNSPITLYVNEKYKLVPDFIPVGARSDVVWKYESNGFAIKSVVSVDQSGLVKALSPGKATVYAKLSNGEKAEVQFIVKEGTSSEYTSSVLGVMEYINDRRSNNIPSLAIDESLCDLAKNYVKEMIENGYFDVKATGDTTSSGLIVQYYSCGRTPDAETLLIFALEDKSGSIYKAATSAEYTNLGIYISSGFPQYYVLLLA